MLEALYNATGGISWKRNNNWFSSRPIHTWFGVVADGDGCVKTLDLQKNLLTGTIPPELGNLASMEWLNLFDNNLGGEIPPELGNLAKLEYMGLGDNKLTGQVPAELGNLARLKGLQLYDNRLRGCVPSSLRNQLQNDYPSLDDLPYCQS